MAAVLFAPSEEGFPAQAPEVPDEASLKDAVNALSASDARELLWKFARKYPERRHGARRIPGGGRCYKNSRTRAFKRFWGVKWK